MNPTPKGKERMCDFQRICAFVLCTMKKINVGKILLDFGNPLWLVIFFCFVF